MIKEYSTDLQKLFLEMMMSDAQNFVRVQNIYNPENFDRSLRETAKFINEYSDKYKSLPSAEQVRATTGTELKLDHDMSQHNEWFTNEFEQFTKRQELERAILKSADLLEKGDFDPVEKLIKDAVQISLTKDLGTDYFADPTQRITKYFSMGGQVSTGWPQLDRLLYGGFSRGELNIFAGGSGSGKSLVMMNIALNWLFQGLSGVYISLELSEELVSLRTDAMLTGISTKEIRKDVDGTSLRIAMAGKKAGTYRVKALPAQSNINDIRAFLKEYQIQTGNKVDFMMVDYLDLLMPISAKVSPNDLFVKDKYVSEELRNLAKELNVLFVTASQLNRAAVDEVEFSHAHISGGISKINTADNVFGIFTSRAMKERGRYQFQCLKSRSSTGVDQKIDLEYNVETMRMTDPGIEVEHTQGPPNVSAIMGKIRGAQTSNTDISTEDKPKFDRPTGTHAWEQSAKVSGESQSVKLKSLLTKLKTDN
jgi:archaellum biogenesis ATPase FlaH